MTDTTRLLNVKAIRSRHRPQAKQWLDSNPGHRGEEHECFSVLGTKSSLDFLCTGVQTLVLISIQITIALFLAFHIMGF